MSDLRREPFGTTSSGSPVDRFVLRNADLELVLLGWGAAVQSLRVPVDDVDVVLGFDTLAGYEQDDTFMGAVVGRYANRIAHGRFELDGRTYLVPASDRGHALHGGPEGLHRQVWETDELRYGDTVGVRFLHVSPDGWMGFPGALTVSATYLLDGPQVRLDLRAETDRPTVVNLTQHAYFNLAGAGSGSVESHVLAVDAGRYLPIDRTAIPVGPAQDVVDTPLDFRTPKHIGRDLRCGHEQVVAARGFDHCLVLDQPDPERTAAHLTEPRSGRTLEVLTDQPGLQVYTGNSLDGSAVGKGGSTHRQGDGICLEPQRFPNGPNRADDAGVVLRPGQEYRSSITWRFGHVATR